MSYIVENTLTESSQASGSSFTAALPPSGTYAAGDLLVVFVKNNGGATTITTASSGWTIEPNQAQNGTVRTAIAWKVAASTPEPDPVFTVTSAPTAAISLVVKDAPTANPIDGSARADLTGTSGTSAALTTTTSECLLLYFTGLNASTAARYKTTDLTTLNTSQFVPNNNVVLAGYRQMGAAGPVPSVTAYWITSTNAQLWALAVKNKTGGALQPWAKSGSTEVMFYGSGAQPISAATWQAPSNFAATVNGKTVTTSAPTITNASDADTWGEYTSVSSTENFASPAEKLVGGYHALTFPDLTGKLLSFEFQGPNNNTAAQFGADGILVGLRDAAGNYAVYQIAAKGKWITGQWNRRTIHLGTTTPYATSGTIDWANVTGIAWLLHRVSGTAAPTTLYVKNMQVLGQAVIVGGGAAYPATFHAAYLAHASSGIQRAMTKQGSSQFFSTGSIKIGDGTTKTYFASPAQSFEMPQPFDANTQRYWDGGVNSLELSIHASAADTIKVHAGAAVTTQKERLTIDAASSTAATYDFVGQSFIGWAPTWKTGVPCSNATFKSCDEIDFQAAKITNCTISSTISTDAAVAFSASGGELDTCTIDVTGTSAMYHIELGVSVTSVTLTNVAFAGTPGTNKVHVKATTGTVTIYVNGTTSLAAGEVTSDGATVSIVSTPVYQSVTISGAVAGSRIQIYDTTAGVELYNGTPTFPFTWTDPNPAVANRAIRLRVAYYAAGAPGVAKHFIEQAIGTCGTTAATAAVSYLVNQVNDTVYINNGLDGATYYGSDVTFTDASTDLVNINVTGGNYTWAKIYAAFVYYRFTEAGIRSDIAYIDAPDTANYLLSSMKLKNISSPEVPLIVTGGWGRDASSGSSKDIIDTSGGDIYLAPDHVVPYATGSGLSGSQAAQLADAASYSALAATESALARKLLRNKRVLDTATGIETVYDDTGAVLFTRAVYSDKDGTTPYNGTQPPHRVERYT